METEAINRVFMSMGMPVAPMKPKVTMMGARLGTMAIKPNLRLRKSNIMISVMKMKATPKLARRSWINRPMVVTNV